MKNGVFMRRVAVGLGVTAGMILLAVDVTAGEASAGMDVNSAYVWRGITLNDGLVAQPWVDVTVAEGLSANAWGNMDLDDFDGQRKSGEFSEIDLVLSYSRSIGPVDATVGWTEFLFPYIGTNGVEGTREVFVSAGMDLGHGFATQAQFNYDVDEVKDFYANLALTYSMDLKEGWSAETGASIGLAGKDWADFNAGGTDGGFFDYSVWLSTSYSVSKSTEVGAKIAYVDSVDTDVLPEQDVNVVGGVSAAYSF